MFSITVDGITYDTVCGIKRMAKVTDSEVSGMLLNKTMHRDIIATYLQYDITIAIPIGAEDQYWALYEVLTAPVESHDFILPYNGETIQINAAVSQVSDVYAGEESRVVDDNTVSIPLWRKISFTCTSINPYREPGDN